MNKKMTLIELLIVISILAVLTTIALSGADYHMDHKRGDDTNKRGESILTSIHGDNINVSRFISDMGRLPMVISSPPFDGNVLEELWKASDNIAYRSYQLAAIGWDGVETEVGSIASDRISSISLSCGWRGPYLNVSDPESTKIYDGYGNNWVIGSNGIPPSDWSDSPAINTSISGFKSYGRDGIAGGSEWQDIDKEYIVNGGKIESSLTLTIHAKGSDGKYIPISDAPLDISESRTHLRAVVFVPNITSSNVSISGLHYNWNSSAQISGNAQSNVTKLSHNQIRYDSLFPGPRKVYVYGYVDDGGTIKYAGSSGVMTLDLKSGNNSINIYLREGAW